MSGGIKLEEITYIREVKDPTLSQYMVRRNMKEAAHRTRGKGGVVHDGVKPIPRSADLMKNQIGGMTADKLAELHPDWITDYNKEYGHS